MACTLDIVGDRWTLLVVRDLYLGRSRFKDLAASPEGVPTNILADRLARLVAYGLVHQTPVSEGARRQKYELTERGLELVKILAGLREWGLKHIEGARLILGPGA